jgi:hypothetical protein
MVPLTEKECCWTCRVFDTWNVRWNAELELESVRSELLAFRKTLSLSNPELSKKKFSFTRDKETRPQIMREFSYMRLTKFSPTATSV